MTDYYVDIEVDNTIHAYNGGFIPIVSFGFPINFRNLLGITGRPLYISLIDANILTDANFNSFVYPFIYFWICNVSPTTNVVRNFNNLPSTIPYFTIPDINGAVLSGQSKSHYVTHLALDKVVENNFNTYTIEPSQANPIFILAAEDNYISVMVTNIKYVYPQNSQGYGLVSNATNKPSIIRFKVTDVNSGTTGSGGAGAGGC